MRIGTKRIPLDKKYPGYNLGQYSSPNSTQQQQEDGNMFIKGAQSQYNQREGDSKSRPTSATKSRLGSAGGINGDSGPRSIREEQEANMKNIKGYQDKGLLNMLDRETTHYSTINKQQVNKPPATPIKSRGPRRSGEVPPL